MKIAVVGGGPGGCRVSQLLARQGHEVTLIDSQEPGDKPCRGVISRVRALEGLLPPALEREPIAAVRLHFDDRLVSTLHPLEGLEAISRRQLDVLLRAEAAAAGVRLVRDRISSIRRTGARWRLDARTESHEAEFLIGADGAASLVRRTAGEPLTSEDLNVAVGYLVPERVTPRLSIFLLRALEGYVWALARPDHVSYGLMARAEPGWTAKYTALVRNFVAAELGAEALDQAVFFSSAAPALRPRTWKRNRAAGTGWALVGDAAGLANSLTGEGLYYALRSAALLAGSGLDPTAYARAVEQECIGELRRAAEARERLLGKRRRAGRRRKRLIQVSGRSATARDLIARLLTGDQPYAGLSRRLLFSAPRVALDVAASVFRGGRKS